jgi:hypothetical protein
MGSWLKLVPPVGALTLVVALLLLSQRAALYA